MIQHNPASPNPRRGVAIIYALVVLAVIGVMLSESARNAITVRRMVTTRQQQLQADWLARSGIELAANKLANSPDYKGETAELLTDSQIVIKVDPIENRTDHYRVTCEAKYPASEIGAMKLARSAVFHRTPAGRIESVSAEDLKTEPTAD